MTEEDQIIDAIHEAKVLGMFKVLCERHGSLGEMQRLRDIYNRTGDSLKTTRKIMKLDGFNEELSDSEINRMRELITAFLIKSPFRKSIDELTRKALLSKQNEKCAICGCPIDLRAHADHIVPFSLVGDELQDNLQMLCSTCNLRKNNRIDYQIKHLLRLM